MASSDDDIPKPIGGPGVTTWLSDILGAPDLLSAAHIDAPIKLPDGLRGTTFSSQLFAVLIPDELTANDDAVLAGIEIRELPSGVHLSAGHAESGGAWQVPLDSLLGLVAIVPEKQQIPFDMLLKVTFTAPHDPNDAWTEMRSVVIDTPVDNVTTHESPAAPDAPERSEALEPQRPAPPEAVVSSIPSDDTDPPDMPKVYVRESEMSVIDMDISVGTNDPVALAKLKVSFDGLPPGAFLTSGTNAADGTWQVPADKLATLSVVMPLDTPDFDLRVTMESDGAAPQSAEIRIANDDVSVHKTGAILNVDVATPTDGNPVRFMIFADAKPIYDRVLSWSATDDESMIVEVGLGDLLPYEVVLRYADITGQGTDGPRLRSFQIDDVRTMPDDAAVTRRAGAAPGSWVGDLVIDVQAAQRPSPNLVSKSDDTVIPAAPFAHDDGLIETESEHLTINVSREDILKPAVLKELARLQDFIRASADDQNKGVYGRLGLDVGRWRDMHVLGPTGAEVELRAPLPTISRLSIPGGRDNTRTPEPLHLPMPDDDDAIYHVSGVPPGGLLTTGTNLGKGVWALQPDERQMAAYLPPVSVGGTAVMRVVDAAPNADTPKQFSILLSNAIRKLAPVADTSLTLSLKLPNEVFDPNGYKALSLTIGDVPPGVLVVNGTNHGGGVWTAEIKSGHVIGFWTRPEAAAFALTLTCIAMRAETGESTVVTQHIEISPTLGTCCLAA